MMSIKERNINQIKSILIVRFISEYCILEKKVLKIFHDEILKVDHKYKNKLYFYYGIHVGHNVSFDFERNCVSFSNVNKYNVDEMFDSLNLNKVIKFERKEHLIKAFSFDIDSVSRKATCFPFSDCCIKLMNMRNKLAHEVDTLSFQEKDIIEILPSDYLIKYEYEYIEGIDFSNMDDNLIALLSNIVYLRLINDKLQSVE